MSLALDLAREAFMEREVPVGAVVVSEGKVVGRGKNLREKERNSLYHAEILAINEACKKLNSWRLLGCSIYVTLEPCSMCAGAIINSRIKRLIFSAGHPKFGVAGSVTDLFLLPLGHKVEVISGVLCVESSQLISDFFKGIRKNKDY
jgi:tRNA(adenine34) deaminase